MKNFIKNLSGEIWGVVIAVAGGLLVSGGLSEACGSEFAAQIPVWVGGLITYISRVRKPDVNILGVKK